MKILVCGARSCRGNKKTGGSFEFSEIFALSEIEPFKSENFEVASSVGSEFVTLQCTPEIVEQLKTFSLPCEVEFTVTNKLRAGQLVPVLDAVKRKVA